jgi:lysophospholipase L1-like esterase
VIKRVALVGVALVVGAGALIAAEVVIAMRRDYLPTQPAMHIGGTFGPQGAPRLKLVVLGDSTAAGVGASSPADAYPTRLARKLAEDGFRVHLDALGVSGARVADVLHRQVPAALAARPDVVFVGIGANDSIHLTPLDSVYRDMLATIDRLESTGARVVVAGAPDMRAAAFLEPLRSLSGWRGRLVEGKIASAARARGVPVVPLAKRTGRVFGRNPDRYNSADDFHPSGAGYGLWADAIYPELSREAAKSD